jgi:hypothetical protein
VATEEQRVKISMRRVLPVAVALSFVGAVSFARELGSREAREKIAAAVGLDKPEAVRIKSISSGIGGDAIVEATFQGAFRFTRDKQGEWVASEVRTGDRRWESIELIQTAIRKEKVLRTAADLRTLATAIDAYQRDRGRYVEGRTCSVLVDHLSPDYLRSILRLDAWSVEFDYIGTPTSYRLMSSGPDREPSTEDDLVIENGRFIKGASE